MSARSLKYWRATALFGIFLIATGTASYFFDLISDRFGSSLIDILGMGAVIGIPIAFIGLIGWAKQLGKKARSRMAAAVFFTSWLLLIPGYLIDNMNIHGSAGPVMGLIFLSTILAVVLLIMAAATSQK